MKHTVTVQELNDWLREDGWKRFASSGGRDTNKGLEVSASSGQFRVWDRGVVVYCGADRATAIATYNEAP